MSLDDTTTSDIPQPTSDIPFGVGSEVGKLRKVLHLKPGQYEYRLVIDGDWQEDPSNPRRVPNHLGGSNSLLRV